MISPYEIAEIKKLLRQKLKSKLASISTIELTEKSQKIAGLLSQEIAAIPGTIAIFQAVTGEPDIAHAFPKNHDLCLPVLVKKNSSMIFRAFTPGDKLEIDPIYNKIMQPDSGKPLVTPDVVILPLIGFDVCGFRLGRGAGYYDRTLAGLREKRKTLCIAVGFELQKLDEIPVEAFDQKMDLIITENRIYRFG